MKTQLTALVEGLKMVIAPSNPVTVIAPNNPVTVRVSHFLQKRTLHDDMEAFLTTMHDLLQLAIRWLQPKRLTGPLIVNWVIMDHYLQALPIKLQRWVRHGEPQMKDQLVEVVERYTVSSGSARTCQAMKTPVSEEMKAIHKPSNQHSGDSGSDYSSIVSARRKDSVMFWLCHTNGHMEAQCPLQEKSMECGTIWRLSCLTLSTWI